MDISYDIIFLKGTEGHINEVERIILSDHIEIIMQKKMKNRITQWNYKIILSDLIEHTKNRMTPCISIIKC